MAFVLIDLTGKEFSDIKILKIIDKRGPRGEVYWQYICKCGNIEEAEGSTIREGKKTCCRKCARKRGDAKRVPDLKGKVFGRLTVIEKTDRRNIEGHVMWECMCQHPCNKIVFVSSRCLIRGNTKSCGCLIKDIRKTYVGSSNPNWNNHLTEEDRLLSKDRQLYLGNNKWSKSVKEKYNYTCQKCGQYGGKLVSHHIKGFKRHPKLRLLLCNGSCLCQKCHLRFHSIHGIYDFGVSNFIEFMKERVY